MNEIQYMLGQSTQPLTGFLERMLHGYQIENVVGMIEGLKNEQPLDLLLKGLDPWVTSPSLKTSRQWKETITQLYTNKSLLIYPLETISVSSSMGA